MSKPAKTWDFTLNNYEKEDIKLFKSWSNDVTKMVVSKEKGENGTKHLQGRITFKRAYRLTGVKKLHDRCHWEITIATADSLYCKKQGGKLIIDINNKQQGARNDLKDLTDAIKEKKTKAQLWELYPETMIKFNKGAYEMMSIINKKPIEKPYKLEDFEPWKPISNWEKSIVIIGESGIGKTEFAKAHFENPLLVSHIDDLKLFDESNDAIIFDDMDFNHWPRTSQIHITDINESRSINVKFGTATIPARTKKIFTCNKLPLDLEDPAIRRRVEVVTLLRNCNRSRDR